MNTLGRTKIFHPLNPTSHMGVIPLWFYDGTVCYILMYLRQTVFLYLDLLIMTILSQVLLNSKLPIDVLGRVWELADIDKDGMLDSDEFAVVRKKLSEK